ncbi:alcohol dehydrogenase [Mycobacterium colombiense]|uniref:zinc-dependent alcohol dehydrogenase n=1 Tax=Mycobacterium colombiense TaxID=339268 RepID=UPI0007EF3EC1|nr:alcohol dehydrogenase catalytic domain-containing protein [Mycobacterium colombiense]OBK58577.1 alcohol dehydrogenase [Mycobacterium colombiense]
MKAAVTTGAGGFEVVDVPDPTPAPDQLVIRVAACGVCGSDIKAQPFAPAGLVMGHELGGEVVATGSSTDGWRAGVNVAVLPVVSCGSCRYCRAGLVSHCAQASFIGMGPPGGFAQYAAVPARHCFALPAGVPAAHAALVEPFAVGLHGVHSGEIGPGDDVLIVGAGGVGLTTLVWALHRDAGRVTVADPDPQRRNSATVMGATDVLASVAEAEPASYDAVIECVGRPELVQACQPALRPRGRLVISGACAEPTTIEPITALLKELTVRYSVAYSTDEFHDVIDTFGRGDIDVAPTLGPSFGLDHVADAFAAVRGATVQGRVSVTP